MACSDVSSDIADISDEIDRQIEVYLSNMTDKQFDDFINSSQLQPAHATAPDPAPPSSTIVSTARFATPKDDEAVLAAQSKAVPSTTKRSTEWACRIWNQWSKSRKESNCEYPPPPQLCTDESCLDRWLCKFILEIRRQDGKEYPPNTLYSIACGILRHVRNYAPQVNFFTQVQFTGFRKTLDSEMKRLTAAGVGVKKKKAEPLSLKDEDELWQQGLLGNQDAQTLVDTIIFMCGLYFALRSGQEHRSLVIDQIQVIDCEHPYLIYTENVSKNHSGGLSHRKVQPKVVTHYSNKENPSRCFVNLYREYLSHCPSKRTTQALYLTPLKIRKGTVWYSNVPIGHNTLSKTVHRLCKSANIKGFKTNHSLRVTTATRLFQSGIDEQLIMDRTGHRSLDGIRAYKRVSEDQEKEVSSILNKESVKENDEDKENCEPAIKKRKLSGRELPYTLNLSNCTNITINY